MQLFGRRYDTGQPVCLDIAEGRITRTTPAAAEENGTRRWPWLSQGLFDVQINGYGGQEFNSADLTPEKVVEIVRLFEQFGVTRFCPTVTTARSESMEHGLRTLAAVCSSSPEMARRIGRFHVEGPYVSAEDGPRGAHPLEFCRQPDWDEFERFQDAAEGRIRLFTMSVEFDGSTEFVRRLVDSGVVVAIGHTAADPDQIRAAVDAGVRLSTHLGNGSHPMLHRLQNYIWQQLADDRLMASIIVDGHHLPPDVVKTIVRAKGPGRCILISDISGMAGLPPGRYPHGSWDLEILPTGRLVVAGQTELLAGASMPINGNVANVMRYAGVSLKTAVRMASDHPARLLGVDPGGLEPGDPADLVQFDLVESSEEDVPPKLEVRATVAGGELVCGELWQP